MASHKVYFWHEDTNEVVWDAPEGSAPRGPALSAALDEASTEQPVTIQSASAGAAAAAAGSAAVAAGSATAAAGSSAAHSSAATSNSASAAPADQEPAAGSAAPAAEAEEGELSERAPHSSTQAEAAVSGSSSEAAQLADELGSQVQGTSVFVLFVWRGLCICFLRVRVCVLMWARMSEPASE